MKRTGRPPEHHRDDSQLLSTVPTRHPLAMPTPVLSFMGDVFGTTSLESSEPKRAAATENNVVYWRKTAARIKFSLSHTDSPCMCAWLFMDSIWYNKLLRDNA